MAQKHNSYEEKPMTRYGTIQSPSRRYRRLRHPSFPATEWTAKNPLLQRGEIGLEIDTHKAKVGDGTTYWNDLPYSFVAETEWGNIVGDIADQTDLKNALDAKQDVLTAGSNIQIDSDNVISATDTTYSNFTGATASDAGTSGLVPAPAAGDQAKFLQGDGTWANPTAATAWGNITGTLSDQTDLQNALNAKQDTLTAGTNINISGSTISATDTTYTASDGVTLTGTNFTNSGVRAVASGTTNGTISVNTNGTSADVAVTGLGSAAYTSSSDYATSAQGAKADTAVQPGDLATVATTGSYNDLLNKPTIPAAQVNSDWDAVSGVAQILNKPALATVATSGDYDDLLNKPTIPTVNDATLTIQKNGTTVNTFTANASSNVTANITVPTKISDLTNDSNFANTDLSNLTSTGKNIGNWSSNVTNCITEIPQDIKLELSSGALTLKAGSKMYAPNGSGVFNTYTTSNDISSTFSTNGTHLVGYAPSFGTMTTYLNAVSGGTEPTTLTNGLTWYDTTNNVIKRAWAGAWQNSLFSLPICIVTVSGGQITSIDQIFNGFGYIGSTVFALPGVKGLIPNGRNTDGTLRNSKALNTTIRVYTATSAFNGVIGMNSSGEITCYTNLSYDSDNNYNYQSGARYGRLHAGTVIFGSGGKITSLKTKTPFHSVDYNDTDWIADQSMPGSKYIDLTLGADGSTYTAPADGYMVFHKGSNAAGQRIGLTVNTGARNIIYSSNANQYMAVTIPVQKGNMVTINYTAGSGTVAFRFIYANGSK